MPGTLSRDTQRQIVEGLSAHEQNLLRLAGRGKSPDAIAQLYRQYDGPNGVEEALAEIRAKIEERAGRRLVQTTKPKPKPLVEKLMDAAGEPSEADGSMDGAGGAPEAARVAATPPNGTPPASDSRPSSNGSTPKADPPAPRDQLRAEAQERREMICMMLAVRRYTSRALTEANGCSEGSMNNALGRLEEEGVVMRTADSAYDWPNAVRRGRPSRVWRLVEEPEGCLPPKEGGLTDERARQRHREHTPAPGELVTRHEPPSRFDARGLWTGWTEAQRAEMSRVVLEELLGRL